MAAKTNPQINVLQESFDRAVIATSRAVNSNSVPVLGCILIETRESALVLTGTNIEMSIRTLIGAQVSSEGLQIALPAKTLTEFVSNLPNDKVKLTYNDKTKSVEFECGGTKGKINGLTPEQFPSVPDLTDFQYKINAAILKESIRRVAIAAAPKTDNRIALTGVLIEIRDNEFVLTAADGLNLATRIIPFATTDEDKVKVVVPAHTMYEVARLITSATEEVEFAVQDNLIIFKIDGFQVTSQLIGTPYPTVKQIFSPVNKVTATVYTSDLIRSVRRVEIFARDNSYRTDIKIDKDNRMITFSGVSAERGESEATVEADIEGDSLNIGVPVDRLLNILNVISTEKVMIRVNNVGAFVLDPVEDLPEKYTGVVMPVQNKKEIKAANE